MRRSRNRQPGAGELLSPDARQERRLYDRLVQLRGTPGSGKTTLARLFEYPTLRTLLRNRSSTGHKDLFAALNHRRDPRRAPLRARLPSTHGERLSRFLGVPVPNEVKTTLMASLLQARTVLGWFRHLRRASGIAPDQIELITRPESQAVLDTIGGVTGDSVHRRAAEVNRIYKVMTALVAPPEASLLDEVGDSYKPFDHIDRIRVPVVRPRRRSIATWCRSRSSTTPMSFTPNNSGPSSVSSSGVSCELRDGSSRDSTSSCPRRRRRAIEDRSDPTEYPGVT